MCKIKDKSLLLIAKFEDSSKQLGIDIDGRIYEQLLGDKESNTNLSSLIIERTPVVIENEDEAEREGKSGIWRNAKIIIVVWGRNDDIGGTTYFDVVKAPKKELITKIPIEKEMSTIEDLRNLNFSYYRETLPDTIKFFSYFAFGLSSYSENNYTKALDYFNESLDKFPRDGKINEYLGYVHFNIGNCYYCKDDLTQAEKEYRESISIKPDFAIVHNNLGNLLRDSKRHDEAEKEYQKAINLNPDDSMAYNNLGILLQLLGRNNEAEREYKEAIRINQNDFMAHDNLGILLCDLKSYNEAEKEYREAIRINPDDADAHYNLGILLCDLKRYDEAEKEYRKAARLNPDDGNAYNNLGKLLRELKRYDEAEREFRETIRINPDCAMAHNDLAILLKDTENYDEAEKEFREAIRINPNLAIAYVGLGILLLTTEREDKDKAKQKILKARKLFEKQEDIDGVKLCDKLLKKL
jgi:tetratricopeptide (TPR) repeat protein